MAATVCHTCLRWKEMVTCCPSFLHSGAPDQPDQYRVYGRSISFTCILYCQMRHRTFTKCLLYLCSSLRKHPLPHPLPGPSQITEPVTGSVTAQSLHKDWTDCMQNPGNDPQPRRFSTLSWGLSSHGLLNSFSSVCQIVSWQADHAEEFSTTCSHWVQLLVKK